VHGQGLALLGRPITLLGAQVTLLRALDQDLDPGRRLHIVHLGQDGFLVPLPLVGLLVALVGSTVSLVGFPVTPVGFAVAAVGLPVAAVGFPVAAVGRDVPFAGGFARVGGVGTLGRSPVPLLGGDLSFHRRLVAQVGPPPATLRHLLTLLRRVRAVETPVVVIICVEAPKSLRPFGRDPVSLVGDVASLVGHPVPLVGSPVSLVGHAVTLVGMELAFTLLVLGGHGASLPYRRRSGSGEP
jgi:hypothetical protein